MAIDFDQRPILVFWESTRACLLACKHCRAEAMPYPAPGELSPAEGLRFIESLTGFGQPYPVLIITGGDVLVNGSIEQRRGRKLRPGDRVEVAGRCYFVKEGGHNE